MDVMIIVVATGLGCAVMGFVAGHVSGAHYQYNRMKARHEEQWNRVTNDLKKAREKAR